jgi:hypothetical protein
VWFRARLCKLQKRCTRLAAASDKVYHLLAHGRWFSPGTPASSTTKTDRRDIAEILLKVALKHQKSKIKNQIKTKIYLSVVYVTIADVGYPVNAIWFTCSHRLFNCLIFQSFGGVLLVII